MGCGPREKDEPIELRFRAVDGKRGTAGTTNAPAGGGVEAIIGAGTTVTRRKAR